MLLLLGRRPGESIYIGEDIILKILKIERGQIQIGIEAPSDVVILRKNFDKTKKLNSKS